MTQPQLWVNRTLVHMESALRYNASGLLGIMWRTRATSPQIAAMAAKSWNSSMKSSQFWSSWVESRFGISKKTKSGAIIISSFEAIDSFNMPIVTQWVKGPGALTVECSDMSKFSFVKVLESQRNNITGFANLDRFDYWLSQFRFLKAMASTGCAIKIYDEIMTSIRTQPTPAEKQALAKSAGVPARINLVKNVTNMMTQLQNTLTTPGEIGTYMNIASHSLLVDVGNGSDLVEYLNGSLPPSAIVPNTYQGDKGRIIVPVVRTTLSKQENLNIRVLVLANKSCDCVSITFASISGSPSTTQKLNNTAREVYHATIIPSQVPGGDLMYYIEAKCGTEVLFFPSGAPAIMQTVVVM